MEKHLHKPRVLNEEICFLFATDARQWQTYGPVANVIFANDPSRSRKGFSLFASKFESIGWGERWNILKANLVWHMLLFVVALIAIYFSNVTEPLSSKGFLLYTWHHGLKLALIGLAVKGADAVRKIMQLPSLMGDADDQKRLLRYRTPGSIAERLSAASENKSCIVLMIENLHSLNKSEETLLNQLIDDNGSYPEVAKLRSSKAAIVILTTSSDKVQFHLPQKTELHALPSHSQRDLDNTVLLAAMEVQRLDEEAARFLEEFAHERASVWGLNELLGICVSDPSGPRSHTEWKAVLDLSADSVLQRHLDGFNLLTTDEPTKLLLKLKGTSLYPSAGITYHRNVRLADAIRWRLLHNHPDVLFRANRFWLRHYSADGQTETSTDFRPLFAIYCARYAVTREDMHTEELITPLLTSARYWRNNGEVERAAESLTLAKKMLNRTNDQNTFDIKLLESFASEWALLYVIAGVPYESLNNLGNAALTQSKAWNIHATHIRVMRYGGNINTQADDGMTPEIVNLDRVTAVRAWRCIRPMEFANILPAESKQADSQEFLLFTLLTIWALNLDLAEQFFGLMSLFRKRLIAVENKSDELGPKAAWFWGRAAYNYCLWHFGQTDSNTAVFAAGTTLQSEMQRSLISTLALPELLEASQLPVLLKSQLSHAIELVNLVGFQGLSVEAAVLLADFLQAGTDIFETTQLEWWRPWDRILQDALDQSSSLGWLTLEADIRWQRAALMGRIDIASSAGDLLTAYRIYEKIGITKDVLISKNEQIRSSLTGVSLKSSENIDLAILYEEYISLYLHVHNNGGTEIELVRLKCSIYAAQAYLGGGKRERAVELLSDANLMIMKRWGYDIPPFVIDNEARSHIYVFYRLCGTIEGDSQIKLPSLTKEQIWAFLMPGDMRLTMALRDLISNAKELNAPWTRSDDTEFVDLHNPRLKLQWNAGSPHGAVPKTLFEFRLRLMLGWFTGNSWMDASEVTLATLTERWMTFEKPEECVIAFARAGLRVKDIPDLDKIIAKLLELSYYYSRVISCNEINKKDSLGLILQYPQPKDQYRTLYIEICQELEHLLSRKIQGLKGGGELDLSEWASEIVDTLRPLQNPTLVVQYQTPYLTNESKQSTLVEARKLLSREHWLQCWEVVYPFLSIEVDAPFSLLDLRLLDIARRCAANDGSLVANLDTLNETTVNRLHAFTSYYARTIVDKEERGLAIRLSQHILRAFESDCRIHVPKP